MRKLHLITEDAGIALHTSAAALAYPPTTFGVIPATYRDVVVGVPGGFDLDIWCDATCAMTVATLYAGMLHDFVTVDDDVDLVDFANDELDVNGHLYQTGDGPLQLTTGTTLPTGLALANDYYAIYVGANTIQLASSFDLALAGTALPIADVGVGTHTISDVVSSTKRMYWHSMGLLGPAADGAITLSVTQARVERIDHDPRVRAYALSATLSAGNVSAAIYPLLER